MELQIRVGSKYVTKNGKYIVTVNKLWDKPTHRKYWSCSFGVKDSRDVIQDVPISKNGNYYAFGVSIIKDYELTRELINYNLEE